MISNNIRYYYILSYICSIILKNIIFKFLNVGVLINIWHLNLGVVTKIQIYKYIYQYISIYYNYQYDIKRD